MAGPDVLTVSAFVGSLIENGGTCTATATSPGRSTSSITSEAFADVSSTICEPLSLPLTPAEPGTWTVIVTYRSAAHEATSEPTSVEVG
jgi:hypothetical protein